jgi:hypothetical protein
VASRKTDQGADGGAGAKEGDGARGPASRRTEAEKRREVRGAVRKSDARGPARRREARADGGESRREEAGSKEGRLEPFVRFFPPESLHSLSFSIRSFLGFRPSGNQETAGVAVDDAWAGVSVVNGPQARVRPFTNDTTTGFFCVSFFLFFLLRGKISCIPIKKTTKSTVYDCSTAYTSSVPEKNITIKFVYFLKFN